MTAAGRGPAFGSALSERELNVLLGVSQGKTNADIGVELFLSESTVKDSLQSLRAKIGANDRAHAVLLGVEHGYIPTSPVVGLAATPVVRPISEKHIAVCFTYLGCQCASQAVAS